MTKQSSFYCIVRRKKVFRNVTAEFLEDAQELDRVVLAEVFQHMNQNAHDVLCVIRLAHLSRFGQLHKNAPAIQLVDFARNQTLCFEIVERCGNPGGAR